MKKKNKKIKSNSNDGIVLRIATAISAKVSDPDFGHNITFWATRLLPAVLLVLSVWLLSQLSWGYVKQIPQYHINEKSIEMTGVPTWLPEDAIDSIKGFARGPGMRSIFDKGLLRDFEEFVRGNVWVEDVVLIERRYPNSIRVELVFRKPIALVERAGQYFTVDKYGAVLDVAPFSASTYRGSGLPAIWGVQGDMPKCYAQVWSAPELISALKLIREINSSHASWADSILGLRMSGNPNDSDIALFLDNGIPIKWGKYTPVAYYNEIDNGQKIANVTNALTNRDAIAPGECLDVRFGGKPTHYIYDLKFKPSDSVKEFAVER